MLLEPWLLSNGADFYRGLDPCVDTDLGHITLHFVAAGVDSNSRDIFGSFGV